MCHSNIFRNEDITTLSIITRPNNTHVQSKFFDGIVRHLFIPCHRREETHQNEGSNHYYYYYYPHISQMSGDLITQLYTNSSSVTAFTRITIPILGWLVSSDFLWDNWMQYYSVSILFISMKFRKNTELTI